MTLFSDLLGATSPLVGDAVYGDRAPHDAPFPHVAIEDQGLATAYRGDGKVQAWRNGVVVHLWEQGDEDLVLHAALVAALDGLRLSTAWGGMRLVVDATLRLPDPEVGIFHLAISARAAVLA